MDVRCPYCRSAIEVREAGVRCAQCATPCHAECWQEHGRCPVHACGSTEHRRFTRRAATRIVLAAGRRAAREGLAEAREVLGGKATIGLLFLSVVAVAAASLPAARALGATPWSQGAAVAAALFLVLVAWITGVLYRGARIEDDLRLQAAETSPEAYYRRLWSGLTGEPSGGSRRGGCFEGCDPGCGCHGLDAEGLAVVGVVLLALSVILLVLPLLAWVAIELVYPLAALATYTTLYGALAAAVNVDDEVAASLRGRLGACLWRATAFATLYVVAVGGLVGLTAYLATAR